MKYILTPLIGLLLALVSLIIAPIGMIFAVWFIKWDTEPTNGSYNQDPTIRGDLPYLLKWFQTPDERFPGGLYEPTVKQWLEQDGKMWCSYRWAGLRNQMMGLAAALGKEAPYYLPEKPEGYFEFKQGAELLDQVMELAKANGEPMPSLKSTGYKDIWRYILPLGPIKIVFGWQVYRCADMTFLAVPVFTLKKIR